MATYPIKMLRDEEGKPFVPLISLDSVQDADGKSINDLLENKIEVTDIKAGNQIEIETDGNTITINNSAEGMKLINNTDTTIAGTGALDAAQGKVLKDSIPEVVNNLNTIDSTKALSAHQGYVLAGRSVPVGGATGQVLKKSANDDYSLEWGDAADPNAIVGDGSIMKIVELSYEEYLELEAANQLQDDTEYHINDWNENERTYLTEQDILNITSPHAIMAVIQGDKSSSTILYTLEQYGQVPLQECEQIGNSFSITSDGMIECLRNGYIEVSGKISFQKAEGTDERWLEIRKSDDNYISANPAYFSGRNMIAASPVLYHIKAGEKIQLKIDGVAGDQIRSNKEYSSIYIKYIFFD